MNSVSAECSSSFNAINGLNYAYPFAAYTLSTPINSNYPIGVWTNYTFSVTPSLPSGLSLDSSTGVISGTPIAMNTNAPVPDSFVIIANGPLGQIYSTSIQILAMSGFEVNNTTWGTADACLGGTNPCNLQGMIARIATETTDTLVTIKAGTYLIGGPLSLQKAASSNLVIVGESPSTTFIDGSNTYDGFQVGGASNITDLGIGNLEIRNMFKSMGGSAFYASGGVGTLNFNNCIFRENRVSSAASIWGGAISLFSMPSVTFRKTQFISNQVQTGMWGAAGALDANDSNVVIIDSTFVSNSVSSSGMTAEGGAIRFNGAGRTLNIQNTYFGLNFSNSGAAGSNGGAVFISSASGTYIFGSVFANNSCTGSMSAGIYCQGGAIHSGDSSAVLDIDRSSFIQNSASADAAQGSAVFSTSTSVIRNSTIALNTIAAGTNGTAAIFSTANPLFLYFNTIVQNTSNIAALSSGIYSGWSVDMGANIIAGNYNSGGAQVLNCDGVSYTSDGYNISDTQTACGATLPSDRQFSLAAINISGTPSNPYGTLALFSGSPAIDYVPYNLTLGTTYTVRCGMSPHGNYDNRGFARGTGGTACDIGAFEYQAAGATQSIH